MRSAHRYLPQKRKGKRCTGGSERRNHGGGVPQKHARGGAKQDPPLLRSNPLGTLFSTLKKMHGLRSMRGGGLEGEDEAMPIRIPSRVSERDAPAIAGF